MKNILDTFCNYSGEKISYQKSRVHLSKNASPQLKRDISAALHMPHVEDFGNYLGVPLLHGRTRNSMYHFILDKMRKKLAIWKSKCLSKAGKMILIQSSLATLSYYVMQTVKLPVECIQAMEQICRDFFWGDTEEGRKMHYLAWDKICQPKDLGGLGFKKLREMNIALLGKLVWQLLTDDESPWVRNLVAKYGNPFLPPKPTSSSTWKGICAAAKILTLGFEVRHGSIAWKGTNESKYTVSEAYSLITGITAIPSSSYWRRIWTLKGPHRYNYLLWQASHGCLPTLSLLNRRHVSNTDICPICDLAPETQFHVFRDCYFAMQIWKAVIPESRCGTFFVTSDIKEWIEENISDNDAYTEWRYSFRDIIYSLWHRRNLLYHDPSKSGPPTDVLISQSVKRVLNLRLAWNI